MEFQVCANNYNPYSFTMRAQALTPSAFSGISDVYKPFLESMYHDTVNFSSASTEKSLEIQEEFNKIMEKQGIVGKTWDKCKNALGLKNGSKQVKDVVRMNKLGLLSDEECYERVSKFNEGQKKSLDFVADWLSASAGLAAFGFAVATGGLAAPAALGVAALAGAVTKVAAKKADAITAKREYKTMPYDIVTGAINGVLSPIVSGFGNKITGICARRLGLNVTQGAVKGSAGAFASDFAVFISKLALYPKQIVTGSLPKKLLSLGVGKGLKGITKTVSALVLREIAFNACDPSKNISKNLVFRVFSPAVGLEMEEVLAGKTGRDIDFSNEM